jgi:hypothetical protein
MATQYVQTNNNLITLDTLKYKVNIYNEATAFIEIVNIVNPASPFIVCQIYGNTIWWLVPPTGTKFKKSDGLDVILD